MLDRKFHRKLEWIDYLIRGVLYLVSPASNNGAFTDFYDARYFLRGGW